MHRNKNTPSETIQVKNEELENYFANTIIPQLFVDGDLILRKFTPPAMTHFNLSEKDIGKDLAKVKDNIKFPTVLENIQEVIETREILEKEIQTTDGKWYQMNILPYLVKKENRANGVILTFVEITERIEALRDLEKINADHETLMFALSHDIGQPLSALSLMEDVLRLTFKQRDETKLEHYLNRMGASVKTIKDLVDGFIEAHEKKNEWEDKEAERINIQAVVETVTTALKSEHFNVVNYQYEFQHSEIFFPRNNLRSIVYNLMNNAIKFRQPDRKLKINISTRKVEGFVLFEVRDNGMGISQENLEQIFEKGMRLNPSLDGTGMGLYIIRRMLESLGGKIEVESSPGEGTKFSVYFKE